MATACNSTTIGSSLSTLICLYFCLYMPLKGMSNFAKQTPPFFRAPPYITLGIICVCLCMMSQVWNVGYACKSVVKSYIPSGLLTQKSEEPV